jgi:hypothetical protein
MEKKTMQDPRKLPRSCREAARPVGKPMVAAKNTECKVVGTVPLDQVQELEGLLTGLAGEEGQDFKVLEVVMKNGGRPQGQLLLTKPLGRNDTPGSCQRSVACINFTGGNMYPTLWGPLAAAAPPPHLTPFPPPLRSKPSARFT